MRGADSHHGAPDGGERADGVLVPRAGSLLSAMTSAMTSALAGRVRSDLAPPRHPITVVWCEDHPDICHMLRNLWSFDGVVPSWNPHPDDELYFAPTGEEALELVRRHRPALFMSDEMHPGRLGGIELFRILRREPGMSLGYFTGCTLTGAYAEHGDAARELGVELLIEKPCDPIRLLQALAPLVERHRTTSPTQRKGAGDHPQGASDA